MSRLVLGIDTVGRGGAVALATADATIAIHEHDPALGYAEELFGLFEKVLEEAGRRREEIDAVAVLSGPGSFTGLRIGVMTAKTLAFGLGVPLMAAPTLDLLAAAAGPGTRRAVIDAGGGHVWCQDFEVALEEVRAVSALQRMRPEGIDGEAVCAPPLDVGRRIEHLAAHLARLAAAASPPVVEVEPFALVPEYGAVSQAERVHGLDLSEELRRPIEPRGWDS